VLQQLVPLLPEDLKAEGLRRISAALRALREPYKQLQILPSLVQVLPAEDRESVLFDISVAAEQYAWDPEGVAQELVAVAQRLPPDESDWILQRALESAQQAGDAGQRLRSQVAIAANLPYPLRRKAIEGAAAEANSLEWDVEHLGVIGKVAAELAEAGQLGKALQALEVLRASMGANEPVWVDGFSTDSEEVVWRLLTNLVAYLAASGHGRESLRITRHIRSEYDRAALFTELAPTLSLDLMPEAEQAARGIGSEVAQLVALAALSHEQPGSVRLEFLAEALSSAGALAGWERFSALRWLFPFLPSHTALQVDAAQKAVTALRAFEKDSALQPALLELAHHLAQSEHAELAMQCVSVLEAGMFHEDTLWRLACQASTLGFSDQARQMLDAAVDPWVRDHAFAMLALELAKLGHPQLAEDAAGAIHDDDERADLLAEIDRIQTSKRDRTAEKGGQHIPSSQAAEVLENGLAEETLDGFPQTEDDLVYLGYETSFARDSSEELKEEILRQALSFVRRLGSDPTAPESLTLPSDELPPELEDQVQRKALEIAFEMDPGPQHAELLTSLAVDLPEELREEALLGALAATRVINDGSQRLEALVELVSWLPERQAAEYAGAVAKAKESAAATAGHGGETSPDGPESLAESSWDDGDLVGTQDDDGDFDADDWPSPYRPEAFIEENDDVEPDDGPDSEWLDAFDEEDEYAPDPYEEAWKRRQAAAQLAREHADQGHFDEALDALNNVDDSALHRQVLLQIAPLLPEDKTEGVLESLSRIAEDGVRASALADLAPSMPTRLLGRALQLVGGMQDGWARAKALPALSPRLSPRRFPEVLELVREIQPVGARSRALAELAPQLPRPLHLEALELATQLDGAKARAYALAALCQCIQSDLCEKALQEALAAVASIGDERDRTRILANLAPLLAELPESPSRSLWLNALHALAGRSRADLLADLLAAKPVLLATGGTEAVREMIRTVQAVGRWWP
jgi:hypothetical protein